MEPIRVYEPDSEEVVKLKLACYELEQLSAHGTRYMVKDMYFDFGQNWKYTGILAVQNGRDWQAVNPRDYEKILRSDDIPATCREIVADKYWYDP